MSTEIERQERRARVKAQIAARNEGTEFRRMTVPVAEVVEGDWIYAINALKHGDRVIIKGLTFGGGDGERVTTAEPHKMVSYLQPELTGTEDGWTHIGVRGEQGYKVHPDMTASILRRVAVQP